MKNLLMFILFLFGLANLNCQTISVTAYNWTTFEFPGNISLNDAISKNHVNAIQNFEGKKSYVFNLDKNILKVSDQNGLNSFYHIKNIYPSAFAILNVDAEQNGKLYNFILNENQVRELNLIIQRFDLVDNKREGVFCTLVTR